MRTCNLTHLSGLGDIDTVILGGEFTYNEFGGTDGHASIIYNNNGGNDLDRDFSNQISIDLDVTFADLDNEIGVIVCSNGMAVCHTIEIMTSAGDQMLSYPMAVYPLNGVNLFDADYIEIILDLATTAFGKDITIDMIESPMFMVGGEMFPVDTTALLLAGVELNAMWILPMIAAIGIGAFVVSRKRK